MAARDMVGGLRAWQVVLCYSAVGGLFRLRCEELACNEGKEVWVIRTILRLVCCGVVEEPGSWMLGSKVWTFLVVLAVGMVDTYAHNARGRLPTSAALRLAWRRCHRC